MTSSLSAEAMFPGENPGELKMYNGCAFERDWNNGILEVNQTAFEKHIVEQHNISTTSNIPGSPGVDLGPRKDGEPEVMWNFRSAALWLGVSCGCLMTRPNITIAYCACARDSHKHPSSRHWKALLQVAADVNGTKAIGMRFVRGSGLRLSLYADPDFVTASNDRRSVSGVSNVG